MLSLIIALLIILNYNQQKTNKMARIYYHNVTQKKYNETEIVDLIDEMKEGDVILYSEGGNALIKELAEWGLKEMQKQVNEYYKEE
jgi:hypothetical protein